MIGMEANDSPLSMGPIDPAAFTGRDEDLILPGESLFDFSEAACSGGERFGGTLDIGGGCLSQQGSSPFSPAISFQADASLSSGLGAASGGGEPRGDGADSASSETPSLLHSLNAVIKFASAREAGSMTVSASATATVGTEAKETPPKTSEAKPNSNPKPKLSGSGRRATTSDEIGAEASGTGDAATGRRYTRSMKRPRQGAGTAPADVDANDSNHPVRKGGENTCNPPTIKTKVLQDSGLVAAEFPEETGIRAEQSSSGGATTGTDLSTPAPTPMDSGSSPHGSVMSVGGMDLISGFEDTLDSNFMAAFLEDAEGHIGMDVSMAFPDDHQADLHVSMGLAEVLLQENDSQPDAPATKSDMADDRKNDEKGEEIRGIASSTKTPPSHQMPPPLSPIPLPNNVPRGNLTLSAKPPSLSQGGSMAQTDDSVGTPPSQRMLTIPKCATEGEVEAAEAEENAPSMSLGVSGSSPCRPVREGTGAGGEGAPQNDQAVRKCHQDPDCMALRAREPFTDRGIAGCNAGVMEKRVNTCAWPLTAVSHQATSGGGDSGVSKDQANGPTSTGGGEDDGEMRFSSGQPAIPRLPKDCVTPEEDQRAGTGAVVASAARRPLPRKVSLRFAPREKSTEEKVAGRGYLPLQKLTAPLSKPLEAVFKFMRKKWREVAASDLNNVRVVCDAATTPDTDAELLRASTSEQAPSYRATFVWGAERSAESLADLLNSLPEPARARLCEEAFLDLTYTFESGAVGPPPRDVSSIWEDPLAPVTSTVAPRSTPSSKDRTSKSSPGAAPSSSTLPSPPSPPHGAASEVQAPAVGPPEESGGEADDVIVIVEESPPEAVLKGAATAPRRTGIQDERSVVAAAVGNERTILARVAQKEDDKVLGKRIQQPKKAVPGRTKEGAPKAKSTSKRHGRASRSTMPTVTLTDVICNRALVGDPFGAHLSALTPYHGYMPGGMFATMHAIAMADRLRAVERAGGAFFPPVMPLATTPFARQLSRAALSAGSVSVASAVAAPANKFPAAKDPLPRMDEVNDTTLAKGPCSNEERPLGTPAMDGDAGGLPDSEEVSVDVVDGELIGEDSCMAAFGECEIDLLLEASRSQQSERMSSTAENGVHDGGTSLPRSSSSLVSEAETDEEGYIDVAAMDVEESAVVTEPQSQTQASVTVAAGAFGGVAGGERMRRAEVDVAAAVDPVSAADGSNVNGACRLQASLPLAPPLRTKNLVPSVSVAEADHEEASVEAAEYAGRADGAANSMGAGAEVAKTAGGRPKPDVDAVFSVDPVGPAVPRLEADESSPPLGARPAFTQLDPRTLDETKTTEGEIAVLPNIDQLRTGSASSAAMKTATARDDTAESTVAVKKWREVDAGALHPTTSSERAEKHSPSNDDAGEAHARDPSPALKTVEPREEPLPNSSRSRHEPSQPLSSVLHPLEMRNLQERALRIPSPSVEGGCPVPAAAASTLEVPDVPPSPSLQIEMLATSKQKDACPSALSPTELDASSFDCFRAEPLLEAEEVASVDTGGSNLRLRNEESWSSVAAAALDISALVNGLVGAGSQSGSDRKDGSCRSNAEGPAAFGGSGGESLRQPAEERPKSTSKKTTRGHASGAKANAERVPKQQEAHRPTDVMGVLSQKATTTAAAGGSVACSGGGAITTTDDVEPLASLDPALNPLSSRPFAFATAARKVDRVASSSCATGGSPARSSTTTSAQPASAIRVRSSAPNVAASPFQTLPEIPQSRGELALIQPIAGGGGASREEVQASYAEAWSSFPSCFFWDESSTGHDAHVQADADSELKPPATRDDPVARWLALSRAEASLEGLLTSSIASATGDVSASAGCEHESERQKIYKPSNASSGRGDVSIPTSCHRTSSSYSQELRRALATDRASEEANPLPTLIRLGRSMTKGLTPTEAAKVATVKAGSADASPAGALFVAPSQVCATHPPRAVGDHDCKSMSVDTDGSRREKRDRRESYECVENQVGERGKGGGEGEGGGVPPRPKKRPKRERIAPTLVCSLPSAPASTASAATKMAFSH